MWIKIHFSSSTRQQQDILCVPKTLHQSRTVHPNVISSLAPQLHHIVGTCFTTGACYCKRCQLQYKNATLKWHIEVQHVCGNRSKKCKDQITSEWTKHKVHFEKLLGLKRFIAHFCADKCYSAATRMTNDLFAEMTNHWQIASSQNNNQPSSSFFFFFHLSHTQIGSHSNLFFSKALSKHDVFHQSR